MSVLCLLHQVQNVLFGIKQILLYFAPLQGLHMTLQAQVNRVDFLASQLIGINIGFRCRCLDLPVSVICYSLSDIAVLYSALLFIV